jgi:glycosyltransferase involved in cell wall biosynthesis
MNKLSIIIPCLNEEKFLNESVSNVIEACKKCNLDFEIIIVDDGSTDLTFSIATNLKNENNNQIRLIRNEITKGLGASFAVGCGYATGTHLTWAPGDNSHPSSGLADSYVLVGSCDIVIPYPSNPKVRSIKRRVLSKIYTYVLNSITGFNIPYYNGLVIYDINIIKKIKLNNFSFGFQAELLIESILKGYSYVLSKTEINERELGGTKAFSIKNILRVIKTLFDILIKIILWRLNGKNR